MAESARPAHEEYRRKDLVLALSARVRKEAEDLGLKGSRTLRIMHVCGTHRSINRFGIRDLIPPRSRSSRAPGAPSASVPSPT